MLCPSCGKTIRPPVGYAPPGKAERREAVEAIRRAAEKRRREMGGPPALAGPRSPVFLFGVLAVFLILGGLLTTTSYRHPAPVRKQRDPMALTLKAIEVYAMALAHFKADIGRYPTHEEGGLLALVVNPGVLDWHGTYVNAIDNDAWQRPFFYDQTNDVPILISAGPDKTYKTEDDLIAPLELFKPHPDFIRHDPSRRGHRATTPVVTIAPEP
jgi:hypothetical protein